MLALAEGVFPQREVQGKARSRRRVVRDERQIGESFLVAAISREEACACVCLRRRLCPLLRRGEGAVPLEEAW